MSTLTVSIVALVVFVVGAVVMFNLWQARGSRKHGVRGRAGHRISRRGWLDGWGGGDIGDRDDGRGDDRGGRANDGDDDRGSGRADRGGSGPEDDRDTRAPWPPDGSGAAPRRGGAEREAPWPAGAGRWTQDDPGAWTRERREPTLVPDDDAVAAQDGPREAVASAPGAFRADQPAPSGPAFPAATGAGARERQARGGGWYVSDDEPAPAAGRQVPDPAVAARADWNTDEDLGPPQFEVPRFDPVAPEALHPGEPEEPVRPPARTAPPVVLPMDDDIPAQPAGRASAQASHGGPGADSGTGDAAGAVPAYVPAEVDHSVTLVPRASVNAERLIALTSSLRHVGSKAIRIEMATGGARWVPLQSGVMVGRLRCSVLLANRQGPLNAVELSDFSAAMESLARRIGADFVAADMNQVLRRARELDAVAARLDTQVELGVEASAPITAQKLASVARKLELVDKGGRFACHAPGGDLLFTLAAGETSDLLAFVLDVPRTAEEHDPWRRMVACASSCAKLTGGRVVDSVGRGMSVALIDNVGVQIEKRYRELADAGLKAGSPSAFRVFN